MDYEIEIATLNEGDDIICSNCNEEKAMVAIFEVDGEGVARICEECLSAGLKKIRESQITYQLKVIGKIKAGVWIEVDAKKESVKACKDSNTTHGIAIRDFNDGDTIEYCQFKSTKDIALEITFNR